jgi:hypothetical protein
MLDEHMAQKASVFVDNEMSLAEAQEYFRVIENRQDVRAVVNRYYLIGEVLRTGQTPRGKLAERVAHRMKAEPAILALVSPPPKTPLGSIFDPSRGKKHWGRPGVFLESGKSSYTLRRRIVTGALVASLGAMAVFLWRGLNGFDSFEGGLSQATGATLAEVRIDPEMQAYMLAHSGASRLAGAGTLMPYLRLVSHEQ